MMKNLDMPIHLKVTLSIREAAVYSNIGINKIGSMLASQIVPSYYSLEQKSLSNVRNLSNLSKKH